MAYLMRLHLETHPRRVGVLFGLKPNYVRQIWREHLNREMGTVHDAMQSLKERLVQLTAPIRGVNAKVIVHGDKGL